MKKTLLTLTLAAFLFSCKDKTKKPTKDRVDPIISVVTFANGTKGFEKTTRLIKAATGDTEMYLVRAIQKPKLDSNFMPLIDSVTKKPITYSEDQYFLINKDSVNWHIEGKNVDSLLSIKK